MNQQVTLMQGDKSSLPSLLTSHQGLLRIDELGAPDMVVLF